MRSRRRSGLVALVAGAAAVAGCNAILDNKPADELVTEEAGTEPPPATPTDDSGITPAPRVEEDAEAGFDADASIPTPGCDAGERLCNGLCVRSDDPLYGCGAASCTACAEQHASAACRAGACVVASCDPGYADCNNEAADGCEGDLSLATSCGACNAVCPATAPLCVPVGATFQCSNGCTPAAPLLCGKDCVDPLTSENHCGGCNVKCPAVANATIACVAGACTFTCKPQFHACAGACAQDTDPAACGAACTVCPVPPHARATCAAGACAFQCAPDYADCNANPADGCEASLKNDPANCGACGTSCAGQPCQGGVCKPPPPDGG